MKPHQLPPPYGAGKGQGHAESGRGRGKRAIETRLTKDLGSRRRRSATSLQSFISERSCMQTRSLARFGLEQACVCWGVGGLSERRPVDRTRSIPAMRITLSLAEPHRDTLLMSTRAPKLPEAGVLMLSLVTCPESTLLSCKLCRHAPDLHTVRLGPDR